MSEPIHNLSFRSHKQVYDVGGVRMPRPFRINRLGHLGLYVANLDVSHRFYGELLGFHQTDVIPGDAAGPNPRGRFYTYNTDHHSLVLIHNSVGRARDGRHDQGITINQLSFQVGSLEEVVNAHRLLKADGANIWRVGRDVPGSNWAVYFRDADQHTVELFYGMEQIGWLRRSKPVDQFGRYRSVEEPALPQPSEQDEVAKIQDEGADVSCGTQWNDAGPQMFDVEGVLLSRPFKIIRGGPAALFVQNMDAAVSFYRDTLGFSVTEETKYKRQRIVYLRAGGEHHSVVLVSIALRGDLGLSPRTTLLSYGLQVGSYRQLRAATEYLSAAGCQRVSLPAEVRLGISYSSYFEDPDGHLIQLYFEMESVGWDGRPRSAEQRRIVSTEWPETLDAMPDTYVDRQFFGPLG